MSTVVEAVHFANSRQRKMLKGSQVTHNYAYLSYSKIYLI